jgi:hypothetical protein
VGHPLRHRFGDALAALVAADMIACVPDRARTGLRPSRYDGSSGQLIAYELRPASSGTLIHLELQGGP